MRTLYWVALLSLCVGGSGPLVGQDEGGIFPDPVATVNGEPISRDGYYRRLLQAAGRQVLEQMVEEELVRQETAKRGITIADEELDKRLAADEAPKVAARQYSEERYKAWLKLYRDLLRMQLLKEKLVSDTIVVTDEDVDRAYRQNQEKYPITVPEGRRVSFILYATEKEDEAHKDYAILQRNPERFGELARTHSISPTRTRGGEYPDYVYLGEDPGADERAIFALAKVGDISPVVRTTEGFFIIRLDDISPQVKRDFADVEGQLRELLRRQGVLREYGEWRKEAMGKAKVELHFEPEGGKDTAGEG